MSVPPPPAASSPTRLSPAHQLIHSTTRIDCVFPGGNSTSGTGFFMVFCEDSPNEIPAIVTNRHVVEGAVRGTFHLQHLGEDQFPVLGKFERVELDDFSSRWIPHPDPNIDLCVLPIASILVEHAERGQSLSFVRMGLSHVPTAAELLALTPLEEVVMIGYPNGIWDSVNNMPVLRRGVTATHAGINYEGKPEFLIDAACFPGSSGSPVMLYNTNGYFENGQFVTGATRLKLLGVLYAGPVYTASGEIRIVDNPTQSDMKSTAQLPLNLGMVIQSRQLWRFEELFLEMIEAQNAGS